MLLVCRTLLVQLAMQAKTLCFLCKLAKASRVRKPIQKRSNSRHLARKPTNGFTANTQTEFF